MSVGILTFTIHLPGCRSLKAKRSQIKPILARLKKEFNISIIESDHHDVWESCQITAACASLQGQQARQVLENVLVFVECHWPDLTITQEEFEILI